MKITIVTGAFFPVPPILGGAVEKVWFALGQEFVRRGHQVTHISRSHPDLPEREEIAGVQHRRVARLRTAGFDREAEAARPAVLAPGAADFTTRGHFGDQHFLVTDPGAGDQVAGAFMCMCSADRKGRCAGMLMSRGSARSRARSRMISWRKRHSFATKCACCRTRCPSQSTARQARSGRRRCSSSVGVHPEKGIELFLRALAELPALAGKVGRLKSSVRTKPLSAAAATIFCARCSR